MDHQNTAGGMEHTDLSLMRVGEGDTELALSTRADCQHLAAALMAGAHRSLEIFTRDLEADIYDRPEFLEGFKQLALRSHSVSIRILLQNASAVVKDGHRIIEMSRRLSSFIEIRQPHSDYREYNAAFMIVDNTALMHRRQADRYEGQGGFHLPLKARELHQFFDEVWARSEAHPNLRRLHL